MEERVNSAMRAPLKDNSSKLDNLESIRLKQVHKNSSRLEKQIPERFPATHNIKI